MGPFIGFAMLFGIGQYISYIIELKTLGSADMTVWGRLLSPQIAESTDTLGLISSFLNAGIDYIRAILDMLFWNFAFFTGWLEIVRLLIFVPISAGFIWLLVTFLRGSNSNG